MAENKKSFLLYCDLIHTVEKLDNEHAGELLKHILRYVNDLNPEPKDFVIDIAFEPIKQALKRDLKRYESIKERNRLNGAKGGRPSNNTNLSEPKKPTGLFGNPKNPSEPKKADNDSDSDSDSVKDKVSTKVDLYPFDVFWNAYGKKQDKEKCLKKWASLTEDEQAKAMNVVDAYVKSKPDIAFRKNPLTWLNGKCWNDDIIPYNSNQQSITSQQPKTKIITKTSYDGFKFD